MSDPSQFELLMGEIRAMIHALKQKGRPELWTALDIGDFMQVSEKTVKRSVITLPGYPKPFAPTGEACGERRWFADEVIEYAREHRSGLSVARR